MSTLGRAMSAIQVPSPIGVQERSPFRVFSALRHRNYRYYWLGMVGAITGFQVLMVAQAWLVYEITRSPAYLGLVGLSQAIPAILLTMFGGVVADRVNRRTLLLYTQSSNAVIVFVLAILTATGQIHSGTWWYLIVAALLAGALAAFDQPARMALIPQLVDRGDLMNAIALQSMVWQGSRIVGPALGGVLIGFLGSLLGSETLGIAACFFVTAVAMGGMVLAIVKMQLVTGAPAPGQSHLAQNLAEGITFITRNPVFTSLIGLTFFNSAFGMSYFILLPVFAREILDVGSQGFGVLMGISGVGALAGSTTVAFLGDFRHKGRLLLGGSMAFGFTLILFSFSQVFVLSLAILFVSGIVNSFYMTTVNTSLQALVPDELRGRVMGVYSLTWSLIPLGGMVAGGIASLVGDPAVGAPVAVALGGGLVSLMAVAVALKSPQVRNL